jgi:hypothetical protein
MRNKKVFFVIIFLAALGVQAQTDSGKRLKTDMQFLADDLLKGRRTPSEELNIAALYLSNQLESYGLQPANEGSYFQTFSIKSFAPKESKYRITLNGSDLAPDEYVFIPIDMFPRQDPVEYNLAFLGQGIFAPDKNVDDYQNIDLQGKAGLAFFGAPWEMDLHALHSCDRALGKAVQVSVRKGALLIYITEELGESAGRELSAETLWLKEFSQVPVTSLSDSRWRKTIQIAPILVITPKAFDRILAGVSGNDYVQWQKKLAGKQRVKSFYLKAGIKIKIEANIAKGKTQNVVAAIESKDPEFGHEWVVLTAHYDHVGSQKTLDGKDGIFNGADDNASGTAAILEVARKLAGDQTLRRSIMIVFCCGEENGLVGSAYFTEHPLVPLNQVVLNINADMVGRSTGRLNCINTGCDELYQRTMEMAAEHGIKVIPDPYPTYRFPYFVDSYSFSRFDIPFIQYMTDISADYHQPTDEVKLINFDGLERITELIYDMTKYYANGGKRPTFKRPDWFLTTD